MAADMGSVLKLGNSLKSSSHRLDISIEDYPPSLRQHHRVMSTIPTPRERKLADTPSLAVWTSLPTRSDTRSIRACRGGSLRRLPLLPDRTDQIAGLNIGAHTRWRILKRAPSVRGRGLCADGRAGGGLLSLLNRDLHDPPLAPVHQLTTPGCCDHRAAVTSRARLACSCPRTSAKSSMACRLAHGGHDASAARAHGIVRRADDGEWRSIIRSKPLSRDSNDQQCFLSPRPGHRASLLHYTRRCDW